MGKGKDSDDPIEIVLLDVKTRNAGLSPVQKKIETAASERRVSFDVLRMNEPSPFDTESEETESQQLRLGPDSVRDIPISDAGE
jgi:hypothetical protein